jgi:hypothetical protein
LIWELVQRRSLLDRLRRLQQILERHELAVALAVLGV